jgi:hypothetical protein
VNPFEAAEVLTRLGRDWPVGAAVRHVAGWTGEVYPASHCEVGVTGYTGAHAVMHRRAEGLVSVLWQVDGRPAIAWYRPYVLRLAGDQAPAARTRRRSRP